MATQLSGDTSRETARGIPLLTTKLYLPPARPGPVPRPRLIQRLNDGLTRKLILISAPAGFGKTTLLSEWRATASVRDIPFAWVSLDDSDNNPARFWAYVITALQRIRPDVGTDVLPAFQSSQPPPAEAVLPRLINDLMAISTDFVLALDDYHAIYSDALHHGVAFLLEHLPPQMHLVLTSRADPPLPLTLLRGRGQLTELRADELRFTPLETSEFLQRVMGLSLTPEQMAVLAERTEGWIVGLQMAALSMQGETDIAGFVQAFRGDDRYILDYLIEQVLARQTEQVQSFLLHTSLLSRLCGSLCEAVTGQSQGQATLEALERGNLFVIPLDNKQQWYRYHHLFAEALQARLAQAHPDEVVTLHRRAEAWYEQQGLVEETIHHALAGHDLATAARLIEVSFTALWERGEVEKVPAWLAALPAEVIRSRPGLSIIKAAMVLSGFTQQASLADQVVEVEGFLQAAERLLTTETVSDDDLPAETRRWLGRLLVARIGQESSPGHLVPEALIERALALLPAEDRFWRQQVVVIVGWTYVLDGDLLTAEHYLQPMAQQVDMAQRAANLWGRFLRERGRLHEAADHLRHAETFRSYRWDAPLLVAVLLYEWNDVAAAVQQWEEGLQHPPDGSSGLILYYTHHLALAYQAKGEIQRASDTMASAVRAAVALDATEEAFVSPSAVQALQAHLWLRQGKLDDAEHWLVSSGLSAENEADYRHLIGHLTLARLRIAQGRAQEVLPLLMRLHRHAQIQGRVRNQVEILALQAVALQQQDATAEALDRLAEALALAEPEGYIRTFVDESEPMAALLRLAAPRGIHPRYVARLLAAFPATAAKPQATAQPLIEPLSDREREVLQWMAQDLSNQEIAEKLVITVGTVKTHASNIYSKLGVRSRFQAVARARELNLLPS